MGFSWHDNRRALGGVGANAGGLESPCRQEHRFTGHGAPSPAPPSASEIRLLSKAVCNTLTRCWEWTGWKAGREGYGQIKVDGRGARAHRVAYEVFVGPIPEGLQVLHRCDNPPCINPDHLYAGTHQDNMADVAASGVQAGENNPRAKITAGEVAEIRERYERGESAAHIADEFGLSRRYVNDIVSKRRWAR